MVVGRVAAAIREVGVSLRSLVRRVRGPLRAPELHGRFLTQGSTVHRLREIGGGRVRRLDPNGTFHIRMGHAAAMALRIERTDGSDLCMHLRWPHAQGPTRVRGAIVDIGTIDLDAPGPVGAGTRAIFRKGYVMVLLPSNERLTPLEGRFFDRAEAWVVGVPLSAGPIRTLAQDRPPGMPEATRTH